MALALGAGLLNECVCVCVCVRVWSWCDGFEVGDDAQGLWELGGERP